MQTKTFKDEIKDILKEEPGSATPYEIALRLLKETAAGIRSTMFPDEERVDVRVEPGFTVNLGQQYKIVLSIPSQGFSDTIFRAYIPIDGFPVTLDLFDNNGTTCDDEQSLRTNILNFLKNQSVRLRLRGLRDILSQG